MTQDIMPQEPPQIPLDEFDGFKTKFTEVSVNALGGDVIACSDDFFVSRHNLIKPGVSSLRRR